VPLSQGHRTPHLGFFLHGQTAIGRIFAKDRPAVPGLTFAPLDGRIGIVFLFVVKTLAI
jgi:hypothetical protein